QQRRHRRRARRAVRGGRPGIAPAELIGDNQAMQAVIRSYNGVRPKLGREVFLAETCALIGDVTVGDNASVWYSTVLRGDVMPIVIGPRTSMQDGTIVHTTSGRFAATVGADCTIGHGVILHGC